MAKPVLGGTSAALCGVCGRIATFTCSLCGTPVCRMCITPSGACRSCIKGKRIK